MMLKDPRIAILIVTHNHQSYVKALIDSCKKVPEIKKYICDAASTDGTLLSLEAEIEGYGDFHLLAKNQLESFSKNNNDLIREFNLFDHDILMVNPDCSFTEEGLRKFLAQAMAVEGVGVAAPVIHYPDAREQVTWRKYPSLYSFFYRRFIGSTGAPGNQFISKKSDSVFAIEWAIGAFLYVSNRLLMANGGALLDERYRLYCEDADLCLSSYYHRLKVVGIKVNGIYHALQEHSRKKFSKYNYWNISSGLKFMRKWNFHYFFLVRTIRSK